MSDYVTENAHSNFSSTKKVHGDLCKIIYGQICLMYRILFKCLMDNDGNESDMLYLNYIKVSSMNLNKFSITAEVILYCDIDIY